MSDRGIVGQERATLALARANVYNFLAAVYATPPTPDMVSRIVDGTLADAMLSFEAIRPHLKDLEHELIGVDVASLAEVLAVEHRRLFVGPGAGYVAPYQSVYTDHQTIEMSGMRYADIAPSSKTVEGLLWGSSTVSTLQKYRETGVEPIGDLAGVPDHVALQLQFMQHLCGREAAAWNAGRPEEATIWLEREKQFVGNHLAPWMERFTSCVLDHARHSWYRVAAMLTAEFVGEELSELSSSSSTDEHELTPCLA